jgi:hypothetical protein
MIPPKIIYICFYKYQKYVSEGKWIDRHLQLRRRRRGHSALATGENGGNRFRHLEG